MTTAPSIVNGPRRAWRNLTFLNMAHANNKRGTDGVYDAHISVVLCGSDHTRWICYGFVDTQFKSDSFNGDDYPEDEDSEGEEDECTRGDPIASDSDKSCITAGQPIWDPREYFLHIVDIRMKQVVSEWMYLSRKVESGVRCNIEHVRGPYKFKSTLTFYVECHCDASLAAQTAQSS